MTQDEVLSILKLGVNVFLTGEPGSGKTHTINKYISWLREREVDPSVTASTGIAATHVGGMTIHSWSGIGVKKSINDWDVEMISTKEKTALRIVNAKVLIIDEISMLDARTLDSVDKVLRVLRHKTMMPEEPFGGLQIIFVGDFFQLPPISRGEQAQFAFESKAWKEANPVICYLSEQHRQEDGVFLGLLNAVRRGEVEEEHYEILKSRMKLENKGDATRLHTHNAEADRINESSLAKVEGNTRVYEMTSRGARTLVDSLKQNCLSPERLTLKVGARVMFTRNNFDEGYVNGTLGTVIDFASNGYPVIETRGGVRIQPEQGEWSIVDGSRVLAQIKQVPLRLAWAITIHKSQGMSLDAAVIDLSQAFEFGQGYVALSRVRTLEGLFLEGFNNRALLLHPRIIEQDAVFRAKSAAAQKRITEIARDDREKLESNFLRAIGAREPKVKKEKPLSISPEDEPKGNKLERIRSKYPNAYRPWSAIDDTQLREMFAEKISEKEMAKRFGRQSSALKGRLQHLELIPNPWKDRQRSPKSKE